jgi:hypothetical protein
MKLCKDCKYFQDNSIKTLAALVSTKITYEDKCNHPDMQDVIYGKKFEIKKARGICGISNPINWEAK